jgi:hypothetical protein
VWSIKPLTQRFSSPPRDTANSSLTAHLFPPLVIFALGAMIAAAALGLLVGADEGQDIGVMPDPRAWRLGAVGALLGSVGAVWAMWVLRRLPAANDNCTRYGRHIVGLTFVLLVIGLCNATGMSTLALEGGLEFSGAALRDASDLAHVTKADARRDDAEKASIAAQRAVQVATRSLARAVEARAMNCARQPPAPSDLLPGVAATAPDPCEAALQRVTQSEDKLELEQYALEDASRAFTKTLEACNLARQRRKQALFFLISMSTVTALFGAAFYVVNCVRRMRPRYARPSTSGSPDTGSRPNGSDATISRATVPATAPLSTAGAEATPQDVRSTPATATPADTSTDTSNGSRSAMNGATPPAPKLTSAESSHESTAEDFDSHAFWSGAFFRIGEAVLFTLVFFWLIWSSEGTQYVIWLPVLALFVGMFVKTGETIIFNLGMRILYATNAFLPTALPDRPEPDNGNERRIQKAPRSDPAKSRNGAGQPRIAG